MGGTADLAGHDAVDPARVGIVGHSEGGIVAPMAARAPSVVFGSALSGVPYQSV